MLTIDLNGGVYNNLDTFSLKILETIEYDLSTILSNVSKTGFEIDTITDIADVDKIKINNNSFTMPSRDVNLRILWKVKQLTITFMSDENTEYQKTAINYNTAVTEPQSPTKDDYVFRYWYILNDENKTKYDFNTHLVEDTTLIAYFTEKKAGYDLIINPNSGIYYPIIGMTGFTVTGEVRDSNKIAGTEIDLSDTSSKYSSAHWHKDGYTFGGFTTSDIDFDNNTRKFNMPEWDVRFTVIWVSV